MRIGDAAAAANLTPRALRYYEQQGLLVSRRTLSGHREYEKPDIRRLRTLRELLEAGLTIADVRSIAHLLDPMPFDPESRTGEPERCEVAEVSRRRLAELDDRIQRMTRLRDTLASRIADRFGELFEAPPCASGQDSDQAA